MDEATSRHEGISEYVAEKMRAMESRIRDLEDAYRSMESALNIAIDGFEGAYNDFCRWKDGEMDSGAIDWNIKRIDRRRIQCLEQRDEAEKLFRGSEDWWFSDGR